MSLPSGAIAGIVVGSIVFIIVLFAYKKYTDKKKEILEAQKNFNLRAQQQLEKEHPIIEIPTERLDRLYSPEKVEPTLNDFLGEFGKEKTTIFQQMLAKSFLWKLDNEVAEYNRLNQQKKVNLIS